jgi:hypothetical protein
MSFEDYLENKFRYGADTFTGATINGNLDNTKWFSTGVH